MYLCVCCRENKTKFGLEWSADDTEVGYFLNSTYHYEPSMSYANPMTFHITSINTVLVVSECAVGQDAPLLHLCIHC